MRKDMLAYSGSSLPKKPKYSHPTQIMLSPQVAIEEATIDVSRDDEDDAFKGTERDHELVLHPISSSPSSLQIVNLKTSQNVLDSPISCIHDAPMNMEPFDVGYPLKSHMYQQNSLSEGPGTEHGSIMDASVVMRPVEEISSIPHSNSPYHSNPVPNSMSIPMQPSPLVPRPPVSFQPMPMILPNPLPPPMNTSSGYSTDVQTIDGVVYNSRGYEICGELNQHNKPCQRIGKCPFHKSKQEIVIVDTTPIPEGNQAVGSTTEKPQPIAEKSSDPEPEPISKKKEKESKPSNPNAPKKTQYKQGWTKEEHARFLTGLQLHGKGQWKEIAALVGTRTSTQIQSHAQKYFNRLKQSNKNKRSIHDMTFEEVEFMPKEAQTRQVAAKTSGSTAPRNTTVQAYQYPLGTPPTPPYPLSAIPHVEQQPVYSSPQKSPTGTMPYPFPQQYHQVYQNYQPMYFQPGLPMPYSASFAPNPTAHIANQPLQLPVQPNPPYQPHNASYPMYNSPSSQPYSQPQHSQPSSTFLPAAVPSRPIHREQNEERNSPYVAQFSSQWYLNNNPAPSEIHDSHVPINVTPPSMISMSNHPSHFAPLQSSNGHLNHTQISSESVRVEKELMPRLKESETDSQPSIHSDEEDDPTFDIFHQVQSGGDYNDNLNSEGEEEDSNRYFSHEHDLKT